MSRDIILPGGDTLKLFDSAYTASEVEAILTKALRQPGRNLLDNAYFIGGGSQQGVGQFPINQRGQTEYNTTQALIYAIDRWLIMGMKVTVQADGVKIESNSYGYKRFTQRLGRQMKAGQQYTLSLLADIESAGGDAMFRPANEYGTYAGYLSISNATPGVKLYTYTFTPTVDSTRGEVEILCMDGASDHITATLKAWKLELGPNQTLAHQDTDGNWVLNAPPQDFGLELLKCQRYFQTFATQSERPTKGADFRPVMRTENPTLGTITLPDGTVLYTASSEL